MLFLRIRRLSMLTLLPRLSVLLLWRWLRITLTLARPLAVTPPVRVRPLRTRSPDLYLS
nr:MAG TPA: hypothetical protein [Caudoviricetes sp.]